MPAAEAQPEATPQAAPLWGYRAGDRVEVLHNNRWIEGVVRYAEPMDGSPVVRLKTGTYVTATAQNVLRRAG